MVGDFWLYYVHDMYDMYIICSRCFLIPGGELCVPPRTPKHRFKICTVTADGLFNSLVFWVLCDFLSHQRASTGKVNQPFTDKWVRSIVQIRKHRKLHIEDVTQQVSCVQTPVVYFEDVSICQLIQELLFCAVGWSKIVSNQLKPFPRSYAGHRWLALLGGCAGAGCCRPVTRAHHAICGCALHPGIFHHFDPSKDCPRCDIRKPMNLEISWDFQHPRPYSLHIKANNFAPMKWCVRKTSKVTLFGHMVPCCYSSLWWCKDSSAAWFLYVFVLRHAIHGRCLFFDTMSRLGLIVGVAALLLWQRILRAILVDCWRSSCGFVLEFRCWTRMEVQPPRVERVLGHHIRALQNLCSWKVRVIIKNVGLYQTMQHDKGTQTKNTGNHAQKDEYKAMLNDSSISDLYQDFLEPVAFVQVPVENIQPSDNPM